MSSLGFLGPFGHLILDAIEDSNLPKQQLARPPINPTVNDISIRMYQCVRTVRAKFISHSIGLMHPKMVMAELVEECFLGQVRLNIQHLDTAFTAIIPDVLPQSRVAGGNRRAPSKQPPRTLKHIGGISGKNDITNGSLQTQPQGRSFSIGNCLGQPVDIGNRSTNTSPVLADIVPFDSSNSVANLPDSSILGIRAAGGITTKEQTIGHNRPDLKHSSANQVLAWQRNL